MTGKYYENLIFSEYNYYFNIYFSRFSILQNADYKIESKLSHWFSGVRQINIQILNDQNNTKPCLHMLLTNIHRHKTI